MPVKRQLIMIWVVALATIVVLLSLHHTRSARRIHVYQGKTAQQWFGEFDATKQTQAFNALREKGEGEDILPVILHAFAKEDSAWDRLYQYIYPKLPFTLRNRLARPLPNAQRWGMAEIATRNAGYSQEEASEFSRILARGNSQRQMYLLAALMQFIGPSDTNSVPTLIDCLRSPDKRVCQFAAINLQQIGPAAKGAVPALVLSVQDSDPDLKQAAVRALRQIDSATAAKYENQ